MNNHICTIIKPVLSTSQLAFLKFTSLLVFVEMQFPGFQPLVIYIRI